MSAPQGVGLQDGKGVGEGGNADLRTDDNSKAVLLEQVGSDGILMVRITAFPVIGWMQDIARYAR